MTAPPLAGDEALEAFLLAEHAAASIPARNSAGRLLTRGRGGKVELVDGASMPFSARRISVRCSALSDEADIFQDADPQDLRAGALRKGRAFALEKRVVTALLPISRRQLRAHRFAREAYVLQVYKHGSLDTCIAGRNAKSSPWRYLDGHDRGSLSDASATSIRLACGLLLASEYHWSVVLHTDRLRWPLEVFTTATGVRELMREREGPRTRDGRRAALLHWVREHSRRVDDDREILVRGHLRGKRRCEWLGYVVDVEPAMDVPGGWAL